MSNEIIFCAMKFFNGKINVLNKTLFEIILQFYFAFNMLTSYDNFNYLKKLKNNISFSNNISHIISVERHRFCIFGSRRSKNKKN